jgi:hypothetical protein
MLALCDEQRTHGRNRYENVGELACLLLDGKKEYHQRLKIHAPRDRWGPHAQLPSRSRNRDGDALSVVWHSSSPSESQNIRDELIGPKGRCVRSRVPRAIDRLGLTPRLLEYKSCKDHSQSAGSGLALTDDRPSRTAIHADQ